MLLKGWLLFLTRVHFLKKISRGILSLQHFIFFSIIDIAVRALTEVVFHDTSTCIVWIKKKADELMYLILTSGLRRQNYDK